MQDDSNNNEIDEVLIGTKFIGLNQLECVYMYTRLHCRKGKLSPQQENSATWDPCNTTQELHTTNKGADIIQHVAIQAIGSNSITAENLLTAPPFDASYEYHVLAEVARK